MDGPNSGELFEVYNPYFMSVMRDDPAETIRLIRDLADAAPDDDHLKALAISLVETYIHQHAPDGFPYFEERFERVRTLGRRGRIRWRRCPTSGSAASQQRASRSRAITAVLRRATGAVAQ
jgi:hypothetical protein